MSDNIIQCIGLQYTNESEFRFYFNLYLDKENVDREFQDLQIQAQRDITHNNLSLKFSPQIFQNTLDCCNNIDDDIVLNILNPQLLDHSIQSQHLINFLLLIYNPKLHDDTSPNIDETNISYLYVITCVSEDILKEIQDNTKSYTSKSCNIIYNINTTEISINLSNALIIDFNDREGRAKPTKQDYTFTLLQKIHRQFHYLNEYILEKQKKTS